MINAHPIDQCGGRRLSVSRCVANVGTATCSELPLCVSGQRWTRGCSWPSHSTAHAAQPATGRVESAIVASNEPSGTARQAGCSVATGRIDRGLRPFLAQRGDIDDRSSRFPKSSGKAVISNGSSQFMVFWTAARTACSGNASRRGRSATAGRRLGDADARADGDLGACRACAQLERRRDRARARCARA